MTCMTFTGRVTTYWDQIDEGVVLTSGLASLFLSACVTLLFIFMYAKWKQPDGMKLTRVINSLRNMKNPSQSWRHSKVQF